VALDVCHSHYDFSFTNILLCNCTQERMDNYSLMVRTIFVYELEGVSVQSLVSRTGCLYIV